jgi:hypothetical protein
VGVEGGSEGSELGTLGVAGAVSDDARRVEFVDADEVVESSPISMFTHVWSVASGAKDTRRFAT